MRLPYLPLLSVLSLWPYPILCGGPADRHQCESFRRQGRRLSSWSRQRPRPDYSGPVRRIPVGRETTVEPDLQPGTYLRGGLKLPKRLSLDVGIENLADKFYFEHLNSLNPFTRERIPELGRNVFVGVTKKW